MFNPGLIILAAGGSSRMGRPKQLLRCGEVTLLAHACKTALEVGTFSPVIVVLGNEACVCQRVIEELPVFPVENPRWTEGLGSSIACGLRALLQIEPSCPGALIMLADQPTVTPGHLGTLLALWNPTEQPITATAYPHGPGVPALFSREFFRELAELRGDRGARHVLEREANRVIIVSPRSKLIDLDTPNDFESFRLSPQSHNVLRDASLGTR